jgi:hypothetical protein
VKQPLVKILLWVYNEAMLLGYILVVAVIFYFVYPEDRPKVKVQKRKQKLRFWIEI